MPAKGALYSPPLVKLIQEKIVKALKVALNRFPVPLWRVCEKVGGADWEDMQLIVGNRSLIFYIHTFWITGVRLIPHPAEFSIDDNVTLTCQIDLTRLEEGDKMESIVWYYDSELMCSYYQCEKL